MKCPPFAYHRATDVADAVAALAAADGAAHVEQQQVVIRPAGDHLQPFSGKPRPARGRCQRCARA